MQYSHRETSEKIDLELFKGREKRDNLHSICVNTKNIVGESVRERVKMRNLSVSQASASLYTKVAAAKRAWLPQDSCLQLNYITWCRCPLIQNN